MKSVAWLYLIASFCQAPLAGAIAHRLIADWNRKWSDPDFALFAFITFGLLLTFHLFRWGLLLVSALYLAAGSALAMISAVFFGIHRRRVPCEILTSMNFMSIPFGIAVAVYATRVMRQYPFAATTSHPPLPPPARRPEPPPLPARLAPTPPPLPGERVQ